MEIGSGDTRFDHAFTPAAARPGMPFPVTDEQVWSRFKEGDEAAFEFIYTKYFPVLYNYGRQFTRDADLVKDVIQDLFIYLREKRGRISGVSSVKFYLYKSYRNRIVRELNKVNLSIEDMEYQDEDGFEIALGEEFQLSRTLDDDLRQKMENAFSVLSKRQKEIIVYYYYEGFSYAEITSIMGFGKIEYARILMSRTILKLRKVLGDSAWTAEIVLLAILVRR